MNLSTYCRLFFRKCVALRKVYRYQSVIIRRKTKKYEQDNDQMKKDKGTNNDLQNTKN